MRYQICFNDNDSTMEFYVHVNAHIYLFIHSPTDFLLHGSLTSHQRNISFAVSPYIYLLRYVCTCMFLCACAISSLGKNHKHEVGTTFTLKTFVIARITTCSTLHRYTFFQNREKEERGMIHILLFISSSVSHPTGHYFGIILYIILFCALLPQ
jgi:hypothetical protein